MLLSVEQARKITEENLERIKKEELKKVHETIELSAVQGKFFCSIECVRNLDLLAVKVFIREQIQHAGFDCAIIHNKFIIKW